MKTIRRSNMAGVFFVIAALGALYFYRRQGGDYSELMKKGQDRLRSLREQINRRAPSVSRAELAH
ncbi:MAG TPA: hypothetical protein VM432_07525 [Bdellovibrionales bacterium]|jgi:hypothetical protein|nr:hypothetical protein [Bdellovibrionales bacterium]